MRKLGAVVIATMVLAWLTLAAVPARAETFVDVQSFVNSLGNTVTVTDTYEINGAEVVLVSRDMTEVRPDGFVLVTKSWDFYPSGSVKSSDETRNSAIAPTTIHRDYSESGMLLFQRSEMSLNGELALVVLTEYNAEGYLVSQEERKLITLADGTQVWEVTVSTYALDGTVASATVTQYPYGYNFDAPPSAEQPPAEEPPADQPPADEDHDDRPGYGHGDRNHEHYGPPGHGNGGGSSSNDHDKNKDKDDKGKSKDKDK